MFKPTHKKKSKINIIPMIDVIFFLLVFFMLFTSFRTTPSGIEMELPRAVTVSDQKENQMIVEINADGNYYYEGENLPLTKIKEIAKDNKEDEEKFVVIIKADKETRYRAVINLMDNLRQEGIYNLALAAEKEETTDS
ncbi:MAG: ExbD/TolR family protein [Bacillota bacterium]